jgi:hypothetical protein
MALMRARTLIKHRRYDPESNNALLFCWESEHQARVKWNGSTLE